MSSGAPDWQRVFTLVPPSMTHGAPDWERTAVGPGGEPISGITTYGQIVLGATVPLPDGALTPVGQVVCSNTAPGLAVVSFIVVLGLTLVGAADGVVIELGGDFTPYSGFPYFDYVPGSGAVAATVITVTGTVLGQLTIAGATIALDAQTTAGCSGAVEFPPGGVVAGVWTP